MHPVATDPYGESEKAIFVLVWFACDEMEPKYSRLAVLIWTGSQTIDRAAPTDVLRCYTLRDLMGTFQFRPSVRALVTARL